MDIKEAILTRRSIRSYKPDPVPRKILENLIETSKWSPSGSNSQPWELHILGGQVLDNIKDQIVKHVQLSPGHPDIPYPQMPEPYLSRQRDLVKLMDAYHFPPETENLNEKRTAFRITSQRFFEAPNVIIVCVDKAISPRAFMGLGMIAQTIALAALNYGLGTCIMSMAVYWPEIYRESLGIPESKIIAFGIAIGYPNAEDRVNQFPRTREPLDANVHWYGV